jgi:hypothetical protein
MNIWQKKFVFENFRIYQQIWEKMFRNKGRITNPSNGASHILPICDRLCVFFCLVIKVQMTSNNIELIANMKPYAHKIINNRLEINFFVYIKGHKSD